MKINSKEEQDFIVTFYDRIWIGLSDREKEGKFKWADGTELEGKGLWQRREPNDSDGYEDCVEVSRGGGGWNDMPCNVKLSFVCEL